MKLSPLPETQARITARAEGAINHLRSVKWFNGLRGTNATTLERAIGVIESQRDEILALNAYIDSLEADTGRLAIREREAPDA